LGPELFPLHPPPHPISKSVSLATLFLVGLLFFFPQVHVSGVRNFFSAEFSRTLSADDLLFPEVK